MQLRFSPPLSYWFIVPWAFLCCTAWFAGAIASGEVALGEVAADGFPAGGLFGFTAASPAVLPGIAGADELPLTEPPNVEGEVTDEPGFAVAPAPPAALPTDVPDVVAVPCPADPPPAACAYTTGEAARAVKATPLRRHTIRFLIRITFSDYEMGSLLLV
jgi:hypothetical protein